MRAVRKGSTWLEALVLPTRRARQGSIGFACRRCDPVERGGHEDSSFCSVSAYIAYRNGTYTCMPYVYNLSQDVEKCTLDLVLSSCTRTNTIQGIALASKQCPKFLQERLTARRHCCAHEPIHTYVAVPVIGCRVELDDDLWRSGPMELMYNYVV